VVKKVLVIGYGNSLRGDDGLGVAAALQLRQHLRRNTVTIVACHQLMPELAQDLADVDLAVFIDASVGSPPGCLAVVPLDGEAAPAHEFTHHFNPAALLSVGEQLYGRRPKAFLISVGAQSFDLADRLSEPVAAALPKVIAEVKRIIRRG
jgi:hydrogenase maturation protease